MIFIECFFKILAGSSGLNPEQQYDVVPMGLELVGSDWGLG